MAETANRNHRLGSAAASTNDTLVTAGRGMALRGITGYNAKASGVYLKLYDKATAPTSADTPELSIYLPASASFDFEFDYAFDLGLGYRLTTDVADAGTTALLAADILGLNIMYRT